MASVLGRFVCLIMTWRPWRKVVGHVANSRQLPHEIRTYSYRQQDCREAAAPCTPWMRTPSISAVAEGPVIKTP